MLCPCQRYQKSGQPSFSDERVLLDEEDQSRQRRCQTLYHCRSQSFAHPGIGGVRRQSRVLSLQSEYPFTNRVGVGYQEDQLELGLMQGGSASLGGAENSRQRESFPRRIFLSFE